MGVGGSQFFLGLFDFVVYLYIFCLGWQVYNRPPPGPALTSAHTHTHTHTHHRLTCFMTSAKLIASSMPGGGHGGEGVRESAQLLGARGGEDEPVR